MSVKGYFRGLKTCPAYIYRLNIKMRLTMLCLSGFELYARWMPLNNRVSEDHKVKTKTIVLDE